MVILAILATFWITGFLWALLFFWFTDKQLYTYLSLAITFLFVLWPLLIPVIFYQRRTYGPFDCWNIDP